MKIKKEPMARKLMFFCLQELGLLTWDLLKQIGIRKVYKPIQ